MYAKIQMMKIQNKKTSFIQADQGGVGSELRDHELRICGEK